MLSFPPAESSTMRPGLTISQRRSLLAVVAAVVLMATLLSVSTRPTLQVPSVTPSTTHLSPQQHTSIPEQLSNTHIRWHGNIYVLQHDTSPSRSTLPPLQHLNDDKTAKKEAKTTEKQQKKKESTGSEDLVPIFSAQWWVAAGCAFACVCIAALAAGLTVGLVSIDPFDLQVILETDEDDMETEEEKAQLIRDQKSAAKLLPIVRKHHWLLVTLLLLNSLANETLPLFLDRIVPSWIAVLISVTLILLFGEILPSAVFTGSGQLSIASALVPVVWLCMVSFSFIAWPISKVLDYWLGDGDEQELFKRGELKALVRMQSSALAMASAAKSSEPASSPPSPHAHSHSHTFNIQQQQHNNNTSITRTESSESSHDGHTTHEAGLATDEIAIITGALEMKVTTVGQVCLPFDKVFALSTTDILNYDTLARMLAAGHSRIPVYSGRRDNVVGVMLTKRLIVINPEDERKVSTLTLRRPMFVSPNLSLYDCLNEFQRGVSHLAIVCEQPQLAEQSSKAGGELPAEVGIRGIVTLEDLLERLIKEEIVDETDPHGVMHELAVVQKRKRRVAAFRKTATRRRLMGGASTCLAAIKEERNRKRTSHRDAAAAAAGGDGGGGLSQAERLLLSEGRQSPHVSSPLPSSSLLTPSSARSESGSEYGSTEDSGRHAAVSVTTKRWLKATERVISERHASESFADHPTDAANGAEKGG